MGPRDSLRAAMKQRLVSKALASQRREPKPKPHEPYISTNLTPDKPTPTPVQRRPDIISDVYDTTNTRKSIAKELNKMEATSPNPPTPNHNSTNFHVHKSSTSDHAFYARLLHEARIQAESHMCSIETTLDLLDAMEGLSPYVEGLKEEMGEKRKWAHGKLMGLVGLEEIEADRGERLAGLDGLDEEGGEGEENWPLRG